MIRKNKASTSYLRHPLNRSPSKEAHSFGKEERFIPKKIFSPDKIYDVPDQLDKRGTTFGFGKRTDIVQPHINEPAKYHIQSEFGQIPPVIHHKYKQSRPHLNKNASFTALKKPLAQTVIPNHSPEHPKKNHKSKHYLPTPQPAPATPEKVNRQRTMSTLQENLQRQRTLSTLQQNDKSKQKKSAYRLKYQYSQNYLLGNNRTSYTDFLIPKDSSHHHSPVKSTTFTRQERMKQLSKYPNVGPGSLYLLIYSVMPFLILVKIPVSFDFISSLSYIRVLLQSLMSFIARIGQEYQQDKKLYIMRKKYLRSIFQYNKDSEIETKKKASKEKSELNNKILQMHLQTLEALEIEKQKQLIEKLKSQQLYKAQYDRQISERNIRIKNEKQYDRQYLKMQQIETNKVSERRARDLMKIYQRQKIDDKKKVRSKTEAMNQKDDPQTKNNQHQKAIKSQFSQSYLPPINSKTDLFDRREKKSQKQASYSTKSIRQRTLF